METKEQNWTELGVVAIGQVLCTAAMIAVFSLLGYYNNTVLYGGIAGAFIALADFFVMVIMVNQAAKKAEAQDVAGGQKLIQLSYMGRMVGKIALLVLCVKTFPSHPLALVIPLTFTRPVLSAYQLLQKKGGSNE